MKKVRKSPIRARGKGMLLLLTVLFIGLVLRLNNLQFARGEQLTTMAMDQWTHDAPIQPKRGAIYDTNGKDLAVSATVPTLVAVPSEITDPAKVTSELAKILTDANPATIMAALTAKRGQINVQRRIDPVQADAIRNLKIDGLYFIDESKRYYPNGSLASQVLGITGGDNNGGLEGLELQYDDMLSGKAATLNGQTDTFGLRKYQPSEDGCNLYLTIDEVIQHIVERELQAALTENKAQSASAIVMDPDTGAILAMASKPDFDPNEFGKYAEDLRRNKLVNDSFEPGSTFKIVTASTGIEEHKVTPNDIFNDPGSLKVGGAIISNWNYEAHPNETFKDAMRRSCNTVLTMVGQRIGKETLFRYLTTFGFGQLTGIDFPGEATGIMFSLDQVGPLELATTAFGQGPAVTPIQQITSVSAIANGGKLMRPYLAKEFRDSEGRLIKKTEPVTVRQAISSQTAAEMRDILAYVLNGEDSKGKSSEYLLAGKTGTAQKPKPGGGYYPDRYVASTIGFAPADKPRVAMYVYLDTPQGANGYYGGQTAAPVFRRTMEEILHYLDEPRTVTEKQIGPQVNMTTVPDLASLTVAQIQPKLQGSKLSPVVIGQGDKVIAQYPAAKTEVPAGQAVHIYLGTTKPGSATVTVPDFNGKSMREVGEISGQLGLAVNIIGSGVAYEQSAKPGEQIDIGSILTVKFKTPQ